MLHLSYDELRYNPRQAMTRVFRLLGVDDSWPVPTSAVLKMTSPKLSEVVTNREAVRAALRGTRWELEPDW